MVKPEDVFEYLAIGDTADFTEGRPKLIQVDERPVAIIRVGETLFAIEDMCPHRGGPLSEGTIEGATVTCPWHKAAFDLRTGASTDAGSAKSIQTFRVSIQGTEAFLELPIA